MTDALQSRLQAAIGTDYLIERELGGGGMSRVFVATERSLQRRVVIKVLPPDLAAGVNHERFRREIQLAAQLQHPHIVPLLTAGETGGLLFFTMPFIEGESLRGALARRGRFPSRDVVRVLHDVVDALAYAHARGVVHRDIKPGNILTSGMHALVTDFGVAKALSAAIPNVVGTTTGMAIGTPAYMAPEQLAADPAADHRMDIYAVGLLAYELLTGKAPFSGASPQATLAAQLTQTPSPPHRALPDVPVPLSDIVMRCLEKDAARRPASASALLAELDALPAIHTGESFAPFRTTRRGPVIAGGVVLLAALSFLLAQRFIANEGQALLGGAGPRDSSAVGDSERRVAVGGAVGGGAGVSGESAGRQAGGAVGNAVRPETVYLRDPRGDRDAATGTQVPVVISRAESVAIANAIRKRQGDATIPAVPAVSSPPVGAVAGSKVAITLAPNANIAPIDRDSLLLEVRRIFADSAARVFAHVDSALSLLPRMAGQRSESRLGIELVSPLIAPPTDGKRRVVVQAFSNGTGQRELGRVGTELADSVRNALAARGTFDVVPADITNRASRGTSNRVTVGWSLRADYVVNGTYLMRGDSLVLVTVFADVRGGRYTRSIEVASPVSEPRRLLVPTIARVNAWVDSANVMRQMPGSRPGGPGDRNRPGREPGGGDPLHRRPPPPPQ